MTDPSATKQWYAFRRHLAWTALVLWALFAAAPIVALAQISFSDRRFIASAMEIVIRIVLPAALFTGGAIFAVRILRADDPDRSRAQAWRLVISFASGLAAFLVGAYAYGR